MLFHSGITISSVYHIITIITVISYAFEWSQQMSLGMEWKQILSHLQYVSHYRKPIPRIQWSVASILTLSQLISMLFVLQIFKYIYFAPDYNHRITNISKLPCMVLQFSKFLALSSAKPLISSHTNFNFWQLISQYFSLSDRQLFLLLRCLCFRHWYFQIFYFIFFPQQNYE